MERGTVSGRVALSLRSLRLSPRSTDLSILKRGVDPLPFFVIFASFTLGQVHPDLCITCHDAAMTRGRHSCYLRLFHFRAGSILTCACARHATTTRGRRFLFSTELDLGRSPKLGTRHDPVTTRSLQLATPGHHSSSLTTESATTPPRLPDSCYRFVTRPVHRRFAFSLWSSG